jgi:hypothetical protein
VLHLRNEPRVKNEKTEYLAAWSPEFKPQYLKS